MQEEDENEDRKNGDTTMIAQRYSTRVGEDEKAEDRPAGEEPNTETAEQ